jgi:hypothetical protein
MKFENSEVPEEAEELRKESYSCLGQRFDSWNLLLNNKHLFLPPSACSAVNFGTTEN